MNHCTLLFSACILTFSSWACAAADAWPQFRGPTGQGLSDATGVPVEWSATKNVAWKIDIPGRGWSSPVLADGKLYLTTAVGNATGPISLRALCINAADGKIVWNVEVFQPDQDSARSMHQKNTLASPTPILTPDRIF